MYPPPLAHGFRRGGRERGRAIGSDGAVRVPAASYDMLDEQGDIMLASDDGDCRCPVLPLGLARAVGWRGAVARCRGGEW